MRLGSLCLFLLSELSKETHFILVTHNKRTMADSIFGATMEEPGVSKVLSVDFKSGREGASA